MGSRAARRAATAASGPPPRPASATTATSAGDAASAHNDRKLWPRPPRTLSASLWTTALAADAAYVTRLRQAAGRAMVAEILRVER